MGTIISSIQRWLSANKCLTDDKWMEASELKRDYPYQLSSAPENITSYANYDEAVNNYDAYCKQHYRDMPIR